MRSCRVNGLGSTPTSNERYKNGSFLVTWSNVRRFFVAPLNMSGMGPAHGFAYLGFKAALPHKQQALQLFGFDDWHTTRAGLLADACKARRVPRAQTRRPLVSKAAPRR